MAKVMSLGDLKLSQSRNGFDLSTKRLFSAKPGEFLPCGVISTLPGDKFKINLKHFTRTEPLAAPAMTRFTENIDAYFVPYHLIWPSFLSYFQSIDSDGQQQKASSLSDPVSADTRLPYFSLHDVVCYLGRMSRDQRKNQFGFALDDLCLKTLSYLGYPVDSYYGKLKGKDWCVNFNDGGFNEELSPFPLCAFQKIYQDHIRFDQWEKTSPWTWDLSWLNSTKLNMGPSIRQLESTNWNNNLFTPRYVNFEKDMFFGVYPDSQLGDEAVVSVGGSVSPILKEFSLKDFLYNQDKQASSGDSAYLSATSIPNRFGLKGQGGSTLGKELTFNLTESDLSELRKSLGLSGTTSTSQFSVLQLRMAEVLQRYREVLQTGNQDLKTRMKKVWDVDVPSFYSSLSYRLGGYSNNLIIDPVVNQNLDGADSEASMQATAASEDADGFVEFDASKYGNVPGIIIVTYYCRPLLEYSQNRAVHATKILSADDFANPAFDRLGMEQVHLLDMINTPSLKKKLEGVPIENLFIGYAPRYIKWKTNIDDIKGKFKHDASKSSWSCSITDDYIEKWLSVSGSGSNKYLVYDYNIFKVNPSYCNSLWKANADATFETDTLLVNFGMGIQAVRSLDYNGMPY